MIHDTARVDDGAKVGKNTKVWHWSHICGGAQVGDNCILGQNVFVGANVVIGDNVKIQNNVSVFSGVTIEDDVFCGPSVVFTNVINPRAFIERKTEFKKTFVKKGSSIGANTTIVCGCSLDRYCFVGAGSVVVSSVSQYALVVGNPARQIGWVSESAEKLIFEEGIATCPRSKDIYQLENNMVVKI